MDFLERVRAHHIYVKSLASEHNDYQVLFTAAIGSQNYGLATEESDCDTFTIVLPNYMDFISKTNLISFETEVSDGKCVVKDLRLMMNLLRKTSPNSIEVFASHYKVFEPEYQELELRFFNPDTLYYLIHANCKHMLNAALGMAKQVHGRNMSEGKRYSHVLRMYNMVLQFLHNPYANQILSFYHQNDLEEAKRAKNDNTDTDYSIKEKKVEDALAAIVDSSENTPITQSVEYTAGCTINRLQFEFTRIYLENNKFKYMEL